MNFEPENVLRLLDLAPNIVAMKEASGDINQMMKLIELCGDRLNVLSGDDNLVLPLMAVGGKGVISVLSNILPADVAGIVKSFQSGNLEQAKKDFYRILPICRLMFIETNPIPIKAVMCKAGWCSDEIRMPLMKLSNENLDVIISALKKIGVSI